MIKLYDPLSTITFLLVIGSTGLIDKSMTSTSSNTRSKIDTLTFVVDARPSEWQYSGVQIYEKEKVTVYAKGSWFVVRDNGPGGNGTTAERSSFAWKGAPEGCLLLKVEPTTRGQGISHFYSKNDEKFVFRQEGKLYFLANDEKNPQQPPQNNYNGYADNKRSVKAYIVIEKD